MLASASPRRRELLLQLGLDFVVRPSHVDESQLKGECAERYVDRVACLKADSAVAEGEVVIAADTAVQVDDHLLGKPRNRQEARTMLAKLAGRDHIVLTGVAVARWQRETLSEVVRTRVTLSAMNDREITWYSESGEPDDKAGAYAIQGLGALFVTTIDGNYTNVVGLPLPTLYDLLRRQGINAREIIPGTGSRR